MSELTGAKVLVVEDEYFIAADLARALEALGGETIGPASSLEQARTLLDEQQVDAAILDLNLHGEMAFPLVDEIRERGLPCVTMSGYSSESLPASLHQVPSLEKPVDYDRVVRSLVQQIAAIAA